MKVLLHGEGPTDYGRDDYGVWIEGPVQIIMRKIIGNLEIECIDKHKMKSAKPRLQKSLKGLKGHGPAALALAHIAKEKNVMWQLFIKMLIENPAQMPETSMSVKHVIMKLNKISRKALNSLGVILNMLL